MVGALTELRATGRLGDEGARLVYASVRVVALRHRIPSPKGHSTWDEEAVQEVAHAFVAEHLLGKRRLDSLLLRSTDEASFRRLLEATVRNYFHDELRRTARGALGRRLGEILDADSRFRLWVAGGTRFGSASFWGLSGWVEPRPFESLPASLAPAAWRIPGIAVVRWRTDAARRSPVTDGPSLTRFLEGVFEAADGLMTMPNLVEVASYRFSLQDAPAIISLDEPEPVPARLEEPGPEERTVARDKAAHVYAQLSERERRVLLRMGDEDIRTGAEELGLPKSTFFDAVNRVRGVVIAALEPSEGAEAVLRELELMAAEESS
jgi:hypothetical protein